MRTFISGPFIAILALTLTFTAVIAGQNKDLTELAETEREFAAYTVKEGFRDGFIKFFAEDGIGFGPHPQRTKEVLQKQPRPTGPRTTLFNWAPVFGDISAAGDMGYTTGPVLYTDLTANPRPPWHGIYFSVWKKQADGTWRVAVDMGVDTPRAVAPLDAPFIAAKADRTTSARALSPPGLAALDRDLSDRIASDGARPAYKARLGREFRIHRNGIMPVVDRVGFDALAMPVIKFDHIGGKIARSNDLAFSYGKYSITGSKEQEEGYYVHVWRQNARREWRLVIDVQNPLRAAK